MRQPDPTDFAELSRSLIDLDHRADLARAYLHASRMAVRILRAAAENPKAEWWKRCARVLDKLADKLRAQENRLRAATFQAAGDALVAIVASADLSVMIGRQFLIGSPGGVVTLGGDGPKLTMTAVYDKVNKPLTFLAPAEMRWGTSTVNVRRADLAELAAINPAGPVCIRACRDRWKGMARLPNGEIVTREYEYADPAERQK